MSARLLLFGLLGLALGACGTDANVLSGSIMGAYGGLPFVKVEVLRQEMQGKVEAMHVRYVDDKGGIQVHVIAKAPVVEGQEKDLLKDGGLQRDVAVGTGKDSDFPEMKSGRFIFDTLGDVGSLAVGHFWITFKANPSSGLTVENTLNGDFSAPLQLQKL